MKKVITIALLSLSFMLSGCQLVNSLKPSQPTVESGTLLFSDDFSTNENGWGTSGGGAGEISFLYQGLDMKVNVPNSLVWSISKDKYTDARIEVDGVLLNGPTDDAFGTICRFQDNKHFYGFIITNDGYYGIFKMQDGQMTLADPEGGLKFSEAIRQGGVVNHIQAVCQGNVLSLSINDDLVAAIEDSSYPSGQIGLIAGAYETAGVEIFFDNLEVYQP